jgi:hypothetical protein
MFRRLIGSVLVCLGTLTPRAVAAQADYRNLDDDRPTLIEDAYPTERWAFEFVVPFRFDQSGTRRTFATLPELTYGLLPDLHVGIKVPLATLRTAAGTPEQRGVSGLRAFALWNFNTESSGLPALAVRSDLILPVGSLGESHTSVMLKGIATRSFGATRLHVNVAGAIGRIDSVGAAAEGAVRWFTGAAVDHAFWRRSVLAIGELTVQRRRAGEPLQGAVLGGTRIQLTPMLVLDLGAGRNLGQNNGWTGTIGLTRSFAIDALMRGVR